MSRLIRVIVVYLAIVIEQRRVITYIFNDSCTKFNLIKLIFSGGFADVLLFTGLVYLCFKTEKEKVSAQDKSFCAVLSAVMLAGHCCDSIGTFAGIFKHETSIILAGCYLIGFYILFKWASVWIRKIFACLYSLSQKIQIAFLKDHCFLSSFIMIMVCWLPYIVIRFPAGVEWDAYHQIAQALGYEKLTAHWPVLSSYIMGLFVKIGYSCFHSYNIGLFGLVLFQSVVSALVFAYVSLFLKRCDVPDFFIGIQILIVAISPLYPGYLTSVVKDSLFSVMVLLTILLVGENLIFEMSDTRYTIILTVCLSIMSLLRNNGIYIVIFWLVGIFIKFSLKRKRQDISLMIAMLLTVGIYVIYSGIGLPYAGITQDREKETLSIPFQQTARYLIEYSDDISEEEMAIIDQVLDLEQIVQAYNPLLSDLVKGTYHGTVSDLPAYFKVWFKLFLRHPGCYLDATLCNSYGFFWPNARMRYEKLSSGMYAGAVSADLALFQDSMFRNYPEQLLCEYVWLLENNPITLLAVNVGAQMLTGIFLILAALYRRDSAMILLLIPTITGILVCIASPTWWHNGFRYALPVICANPFLMLLTIQKESTEKCSLQTKNV